MKIGTQVISTMYGQTGEVIAIYDDWNHYKKSNRFLTIDPDEESNQMDTVEKIINGDPKDKWLELQEKPFTEEDLNRKWASVKCYGGGSICVPLNYLEILN